MIDSLQRNGEKDHDGDSDFVRVRVRVFPRTGSLQFIDGQRVDEAVARLLVEDPTAPLIMGVDIARQGADQSVIRFRRGLDARSIPAVEFRIPDPMQIASRIMEQVNSYNPDAMFVDGTGIGWGVHDRLNQLGCPNLVGVDFGARADRPKADIYVRRILRHRLMTPDHTSPPICRSFAACTELALWCFEPAGVLAYSIPPARWKLFVRAVAWDLKSVLQAGCTGISMRTSLAVISFSLLLALAASAHAGPELVVTTIVVSDRQTEFSLDGKSWSPAVATWVHPSWPVLPGATWIWRVTKVSKDEAHNGSPVVTFRRKFTPPVGRTRATLRITADNAYQVSLNGTVVGSSGELAAASNVADGHWHTFDAYAVPLQPGENVIIVRAVNYHSSATSGQANPGGVVFSLAVSDETTFCLQC
jgi:hypothetical protein